MQGCRAFLLTHAMALCAFTCLAAETAPTIRLNIDSQALPAALNEWAAQTGYMVLVPTEEGARELRTAAVDGIYTPEEGLRRLLEKTGYRYELVRDRTVAVRPVRASAGEGSKPTAAVPAFDRLSLVRTPPQPDSPAVPIRSSIPDSDAATAQADEIIVTANRKAESLRDVAQSVTALSERALERMQANDFQDYAKLVPGLQLSTPTPGSSQIVLRGLSSLNAASTTGLYVDSTPYGSSSGLANGRFLTADLNTFDLQRIEVLRGPQGTLYGASTMGGLLKFVTRPPDPAQLAARAQINTEDVKGEVGLSARGMVNVPLTDRAAFRLTAVRKDDPGFMDDPTRDRHGVNDTVSTGVRASLLFEASDALSIRLTSVGQDNDLEGANDVDLAVDPASPVLLPLQPFRPLRGDLQQSRTFSETTDIKYRVHNASVDWGLSWADLITSTSYGTFEQDAVLDVTLLGGLIQTNAADQEKFTQEVQLTSRGEAALSWIAGLYYTRETGSIAQSYTNFVYDGSSIEVDSRFEELAGFATLTYRFNPQFDVAAGLRAAHNKQHAFQHGGGLFAGFASTEDSSEDVVLYSIAPRWRPSRTTTVYARLASGYRPGGPNVIPLGNPENAPRTYDSDTVVSLEGGIKADLLERRLSLDLSAYFLRWKDLQLSGIVNSTSVMSNAGEAESKGLEWAAVLRPLHGLTLDFVGAYTDAALTESTASGTEVDLLGGRKGDPLPYVSRWTAFVGADYEWPVGGAVARVGGNWNYVGKRRTDFGSSFGEQLVLPGYHTMDVHLGMDFDRWSVELYGKNVTDERGVASMGQSASPGGGGVFDADAFSWTLGSTFLVIRPRTVGLMLSTRF